MRIKVLFLVFTLFGCTVSANDRAGQLDALNLIASFADRICNENLSYSSKSETFSVEGKVRAEVNKLITKLVDLGIEGAGNYKTIETQGIVQSDLAQSLKLQAGCKQGVFYTLLERFIPGEKNVNPFMASTNELLMPEPLSTVRSGQRFAMKKTDVRLISNTNIMITLVEYSASNPPNIGIRFTDLMKGKGEFQRPGLGSTTSFQGCHLTYYASNEEESSASFYMYCP